MKNLFARISLAAVLLVVGFSFPAAKPQIVPSAPLEAGTRSIYLPNTGTITSPDAAAWIQVPYSAALNPSGGSLLIEAWVKRNMTARQETLVGNGSANSFWFGFNSRGNLSFTPYGSLGVVDSNGVVPAGRWTHVAIAYDGTTRRFFINGVLDTLSSLKPGAIAPAAAGQPLGIGYDPGDTSPDRYFSGGIDNLRMWNISRSAHILRSSIYRSAGKPAAGLLAEWALDGDLTDSAGGHDGILVGAGSFGMESAVFRTLHIPQLGAAANLDGICGSDEYASAAQVSVGGYTVWLMHTATDTWICFKDIGSSGTAASVYLDSDFTRLDPAQADHLRLTVFSNGDTEAKEGDGEGGYQDTTQADGLWGGDYSVESGEFPDYRVEFRLSSSLVGGWERTIGLALEKKTGGAEVSSSFWPVHAEGSSPSTWGKAFLGGIGPDRTFSGLVVYQPPGPDAAPVGIPGVTVNLIGSNDFGSSGLVTTDETNVDGSFSLFTQDDYDNHRIELGELPDGYLADEASAPAPGAVLDARTLDYEDAPGGSYPDNHFTLGDVIPYPMDIQMGPYYLILAAQEVIDSGALDKFQDFKLRQGFQVSVVSLETVDAVYTGFGRLDKIRSLEQERLALYGSRFHYMLLVGSHSEIPFGEFSVVFDGRNQYGNVDFDACLSPPLSDSETMEHDKLKLSDWPYVDPTSEYDSNVNGCLLDGVALYTVPEDEKDPAPGYIPDAKPGFLTTIAVGRIPFDSPQAVETALTNSIKVEAQSVAYKQNVLHAMSMFFLKGRHWSPVNAMPPYGQYVPCSKDSPGMTKECTATTDDGAVLSENQKAHFLNAQNYKSTILYEVMKPEGASPVVSPDPLTYQNVKTALSTLDFGYVNLAGHGGPTGIGRTYWSDIVANGQVDSPTEPFPYEGVNEILYNTVFDTGGLDYVPPAGAKGAIFQAVACSAGSGLDQDSFGASILKEGHGVGFIGALSMSSGNSMEPIAQRLLDQNLPLGDALWQTLSIKALTNFSGSGELVTDLFGDPTLSYLGNPGGQSTVAAWPMVRYDARGQGFTSLWGPKYPKKLWQYNGGEMASGALMTSPVVSNNGEVIVGNGTNVDVLREGVLDQRLELEAHIFGSPALAADGTIYAVDVNGKLYSFPYFSFYYYGEFHPIGIRYNRWTVNAVTSPSTSPIVNIDGMVSVGGAGKVVLVRPDGIKRHEYAVPGSPIGAIAAAADQTIYVATNGNYFARLNFFCKGLCATATTPGLWNTSYSTPPLLAHGAVFVGTEDGRVLKLHPTSLALLASYQADNMITAGPIAGPAGQVLVGTKSGTLYSLTSSLQKRWQQNLGVWLQGVPAYSMEALYVVANHYLHALDPHSGSLLWKRYLHETVSQGSTAIGFGRELYVQTSYGLIYGYGEGWSSRIPHATAEAVLRTDGSRFIRLEWISTINSTITDDAKQESIQELGFLVQRRLAGKDWEDLAVVPSNTFVLTDTHVLDNADYNYRLRRLDPAGNDSAFTQAVFAVKSLPMRPHNPVMKEVSAESATSLRLRWYSKPEDIIDQFRIERLLSTGVYTPTVQVSGEISTTVIPDLNPGTAYTFRIVGINDGGESDPSSGLSGSTRSQTLTAPLHATATLLEKGKVQITWDAGPIEAETIIEYSALGMGEYRLLDSTGAAGPYDHFPGEPGTYQFRLKFVVGSAESAYAETYPVTIARIYQLSLPVIRR